MNRKPPIYFDSVIIASPMEPIASKPNLGRLNVGVFTKYGNRNGSYITEEVANQLIESATRGDTPVVGFFDPESKDWAGHTGPTLASAYGYVDSFIGWQPFTDTDGVSRDYAVFSVVLFTKYFNEANFVVGQNQSMELNIDSIEGDWADLDGIEYFVYTRAQIMGLCIIGSHEPCFSVSSFFEKKQNEYGTQYGKFSSLLADVKAQVEEAEKNPKGGERQMEDIKTPVEFEETPAPVEQEPAEEPAVEPAAEPAEEPVEEVPAEEEPAAEEPAAEFEAEEETPAEEPAEEPAAEEPVVDFEAQIAELQASLEEVTANFEQAQARIAELETANAEIETLRATNEQLNATIATYAAERAAHELERKNSLVERYQNNVDEEEINSIREHLNDFSYDELESKLAICYSNKHLAGSENTEKVPLPEPAVNEFALFMEKYRKN